MEMQERSCICDGNGIKAVKLWQVYVRLSPFYSKHLSLAKADGSCISLG